jgi:DNA-binding SARP family transcriptional activator
MERLNHYQPRLPIGDGSSATLGLLAGFELVCGGHPVELPMTAQRLLAFLALHDKPLQRSYVAGRLWAQAAPDRAHANLRSALWRVQRGGLALVDATATQLVLDRRVTVDVREADRLARAVLERRLNLLPRSWAILTSDLLPDWYEDWLEPERERFHQLRLHALEELATRLTNAGHFAQAVELGLNATGSDPTRESAHRVVINALIAEGNIAEAVRHYDRFRRLILLEVGMPPSMELDRLVRSAQSPERSQPGNGSQ